MKGTMAKRIHSSGPTAVELFAGAGLFSYAFQREGFNVRRAIEMDKTAAATYARNIGSHIECMDVRQCEPSGTCDVLLAGPPCQGFSTLGSRNPNDPRNQLCLEVVRWAKKMRPKVVVIENVAAFLGSEVWQRTTRALIRLNYEVAPFVLDAYEMGAPQLRTRSFTIASRIGIPLVKRVARKRLYTVREAWTGLASTPDGINHHYAPKPSALALARMRLIPEGGDKRNLMDASHRLSPPSWGRMGGQATDVWGRLRWDAPSNTLRTCLLNPSKGRYIHPDQDRVISLREAARLHTIPDEWHFEGLPTQVARQIGNSVPPALGCAVARATMILLG